jgi:NAD+ diphosphatase
MPHTFDPNSLGPWPNLAHTGSALDRASERRGDAAFIEAALAHEDARAVLIGGEMIVLNRAGEAGTLIPLDDANGLAKSTESIFLGTVGGAARLGLAISAETAEALQRRDNLLVSDLRSIAVRGLVDVEDLQPIAIAKALLTWHARHRFCANCGTATKVTEAGLPSAGPAAPL